MPENQANLPIAVQLYTLRNLPDSFDTVLGEVAKAGYQGVELLGTHNLSADALRDLLQKHKLQAVSSHAQLGLLEGDLDSIVAFNETLGNATLTIPVPPMDGRPTDAAGWRALGQRLDKLGERIAGAGMQLLYHNHAWEMEELEGKRAIDWLLGAADPQHLQWEPDLAWIVRGNADPLVLLDRYAGRCPRIHVKDLSPAGQNEEEKGFADVGYGTLDWAALLPAAKAAGGEWYIVEHDLPRDPLRTIQRSYTFLHEQLSR